MNSINIIKRRSMLLALSLFIALVSVSCGKKGPLYMPKSTTTEKTDTVKPLKKATQAGSLDSKE